MAKVKRQVIKIDEELCNGCGQCVPSCAEGAIQIIDGKARLVSDRYCDGLGACLGECPMGALSFEEREAEEFDEKAVEEHMASIGREFKPQAHQHSHAEPAKPHAHHQGGIHLDHVHCSAIRDTRAGIALVARLRSRSLDAVDRLGDQPGDGGLARPARPAKKIGVSYPSGLDGVLKRPGHMILSNDIIKTLRPIFSIKCDVYHYSLVCRVEC